MNDESPTTSTIPPAPGGKNDRRVILVSYPKLVFLWPTWAVSLAAGLFLLVTGTESESVADVIGWTFLIVISLNLVVLAFDFPRSTSLLLFALIAITILGTALLVVKFPNVLPQARELLLSLHPRANATFYLVFGGALTLIYMAILVSVRFDYWEVRPNLLLHHHGFLSDMKRYSAPHLRIDKEINDIFEFVLLGSGRLILHPSNEPRAIVLDNVPGISAKEKAITELLGSLQVKVKTKT